jgi:hypothetical protein
MTAKVSWDANGPHEELKEDDLVLGIRSEELLAVDEALDLLAKE